jgi:hypothetical protein
VLSPAEACESRASCNICSECRRSTHAPRRPRFRHRHGNISWGGQFYSPEVIEMAIALLRTPLNPFDLKTVLLAKHAQHVVLIHFPIALFIAAVTFDLTAQWTKARRPGGHSLLQPARGSYFHAAGSRHGYPRVAIPTRRAETKRHPSAAPGTCMRRERNDLGGLVDKFPCTAAGRSLAKLPPGD